jgi:hypothetical protein
LKVLHLNGDYAQNTNGAQYLRVMRDEGF